LAHKIKGSAANVSSVALAQTASMIEAAARRGDLSEVLTAFSEFSVEFERTNSELANFLTAPVTPASVL
jgi:HPt (histidine-containing phosphotransfer) domain-containing protein